MTATDVASEVKNPETLENLQVSALERVERG